jgi:hypothetical protein
MAFGRGENEDNVRGGFLQRFEQRVEGGIRQHVHFIDDIDAIPTSKRRELDVLPDFSYVIHAGIGGSVDLNNVNGCPLGDLYAVRTGLTRRARGASLAVQGFGENAGHRGLSNSARARKEKGMGDPLGRDRVHERLHNVRLANDLVKGSRPIFPCRNLIVHRLVVNRSAFLKDNSLSMLSDAQRSHPPSPVVILPETGSFP